MLSAQSAKRSFLIQDIFNKMLLKDDRRRRNMQESFLKIKRDFVLPLRKFDSFTSCRFTYWIDPISYTSLFSARNRSLTCFFFPFNYEVRQIYFLPALNREKTSYQLTQHSNYITVTELELFQAEGWGTSGLPIYRPGCACSAWRHQVPWNGHPHAQTL